MTLEDFFTSTELKDGLTASSRVNELMTLMQKEKDRVFKNVAEATRHWSTVANTIAATENKDCLDLFIQLDGLWFIDKWLKDSQKFENDTSNGILEESVVSLLRVLERVDVERYGSSLSSEIRATVQNLLGHSSSFVHDKAKALCDQWMLIQDKDGDMKEVEKQKAPSDDGSPSMAISPLPMNNNQENNTETVTLVCSDTVQQVNNEETTVQEPLDPVNSLNTSEHNGEDLVAKAENPRSKSDVEDSKEKQEIDSQDKTGAMASSSNANDALESAIKTDLRSNPSDKDEDMVDNGASSDPSENPKGSSDSETDGEDNESKKDFGVQSEDDSRNGLHFLKTSMNARDGGFKSKTSDMDLDYGIVDPLELARQVAIEVEREVDSRERSCSTSEKMSGGGIERSKSQDSTNEKESQPIGGSGMEVSSGPKPEPEPEPGPSSGVEHMNDAETLVSEVAHESEANTERGFPGFDLNQEVCSEEMDHPMDPAPSTISIVSASRASAAVGLPGPPLRFEGTLGWKGSATTSAFRRIPEGDKTLSSCGTHNNSKQRLNFLDIDLNMAEDSEDKTEDFLSLNKTPITSSLLLNGHESSMDASSRRSERLQLDLNSLGDGGTDEVRLSSLGSPSRSSSSSSMQPSLRNFDLNLNDHPASSNHPYGKLFNNSSSYKQEESVISIFGTQVEVKRKDPVFPPNGRTLDPVMDFNFGPSRAGLGLASSIHYGNPNPNPSPNSLFYGHNGFAPGPTMSFYGPPGGPIGYMVDSRGAPVVPQIMGGSSSAQPPPPPPPFFMNMAAAGGPSGSNGAGPSRHNFDLNSSFMNHGGNMENNGGLRQFFNHGSLEEQYGRVNNSLQASSSTSVVGGKRQEPDSEWEFFPVNYKHQQPPWK